MNRLSKNSRPLVSALISVFLFVCPATGQAWREVSPGERVNLPADLYANKDYRVQWWYFTGHLFDAVGREFGYELTFFATGVQKRSYASKFGLNTVYFAHFAISDVQAGRFYPSSIADGGAYGFGGADASRLHVWVDGDSLRGTLNRMRLHASAGDRDLDLILVPLKPVVLNGRDGYSRKSKESPLIASLSFSLTNVKTSGTVKVGASVFSVTGKSWFDRELSTRGLGTNEAGWDWFALQLDDNREIMLSAVRNKDGSLDPYSAGTFVYRNGTYRHLAKDEFAVTVLAHARPTGTGATYPSKWEIVIPSEDLRLLVTPLLNNQEFADRGISGTAYWEGTCGIEGSATGRAYVEMTGY